ncbi:MAG: GTP cyclohydrolase I FolE [Chloroflexi bacterium]|nr:GTP cyclohydrolase I FolE [Chloroflexota bacterium]
MPDDDFITEDEAALSGPLSPASEQIKLAVRSILESVGEDPERDGLKNTPLRVARMYEEILQGYHIDPSTLINGALFEVAYDEMVVVKDIEYYSLCEHHMLPFYGVAHVAYIPRGKVLGLSKIPRVVDMFARRLQVQERMTRQIADFLDQVLHPRGVAVVVEGAHLCSMMRGVRKANARMVTSAVLGGFKTDARTRSEFFEHIRKT